MKLKFNFLSIAIDFYAKSTFMSQNNPDYDVFLLEDSDSGDEDAHVT